MSTFSKHAARPMAVLAATATLAAGLVCMSNPVDAPEAKADELKPAHTTARIVKKSDGTGHGTAAQTFVNSKNGFTPGDDSPTDGVVASGDTVEYSLTLDFEAAGKRVVNVAFDLSQAPFLEATNGGGFCQPGQLVTAKRDSDGSCSYTVPAGGVETMTQTFYLKAKDTGGVAKTKQIPRITVRREGADGASATYRSDELTVVSAPAADLVIDNGGNPDGGRYSYERRANWQEGKNATGGFTIRADALTYPGYASTKGASTLIPWTTKVDVSAFPEGTTWTAGGKTLEVQDGQVTVSSGTGGDVDLEWSIPADTDALKNLQEGGALYYDIHLAPDETIFTVRKDNGDALLNMGKGGEPGWNIGRDKSTYSRDTGARVGYPYANNDWSRAIIERPKPTPAGIIPVFGKGLQRPNTASRTMFDKENLTFADAEGRADIYHSNLGDMVAQHTEITTRLTMLAGKVTGEEAEGTTPTIQDDWDSNKSRWEGNLKILQGDTPVTGYTLQWAETKSDDWHDGEPSGQDAPKVGRIRIRFDPQQITWGSNAPPVFVTFDTETIASPTERCADTMTAWIDPDSKSTISDYVWVAQPADPTASVSMDLTAYDGNGNRVTDTNGLTPGMRVDYTVGGQMNSIMLSGTGMLPTITVTKPAGLYEPTCDDPFWRMSVEGDKLVFTPRDGKTVPDVNRDGTASLPDLHFSGTVSNLASGTVTATAGMSVDIDGNGALKAQTIRSNTASAAFAVSGMETNSGIMSVKTPKAEIGDPLTWEFNVYGKSQTDKGKTMDSMLLLPMNGDGDKYQQEKLDEYNRGYSKYHGTYKLTQPVAINTDNSTATTVYYSTTTGKTSDKPSDYEWKTWEELTASDKTRVTAIRLSSTVDGRTDAGASGGTMRTSAANGTITITPMNSVKDDQYTLWLGRNYYANNPNSAVGSQPWPDTAHVAAGSISGTVWWDKDENTTIGVDEERIEGVEVTLSKQDANGAWQTVDTVKTDVDGRYEFDTLRSGTYKTSVKRDKGTSTGDGVQTQVKTYYGRLEDVSNTRSWSNRLKTNAKDTSDDIRLGIGADQENVDFGYAKPDPKATVDKTVADHKCTDTKCVITWDVKVRNAGKSTEKAPNIPPLKTFDGGYSHSLALDSNGHLWAWGDNGTGQLGDGTTDNKSTPTQIQPDTTFTQVAAGGSHSLALDSNGHLWAWGYNGKGQLGIGNDTIYELDKPTQIQPDTTFTQVAAGEYHSLALDSNGHLWAWGYNSDGQLGDGTTDNKSTPTQIQPDTTFTQVAAGGYHSLALDSNGHLWAWGYNSDGQIGIGEDTIKKQLKPVQIKKDATFTQVTGGYVHSLALDSDGHLWAWGYNGKGQLGDGTTDNKSTPTQIQPDTTFTQVAAGVRHSLALDSDGHLWAWGETGDGQITPTQIQPDTTFTQVAAGGFHSLALDSDGHLWAWGYNSNGQLGDGTTNNKSTPVTVSGGHVWMSGVQTVSDASSDSSGTSRFDTSSVVSDRMSADVRDVSATAGDGTSMTPVEPVSEATENGLTTRTYNLPYAIEPGGYIVYRFTGTVDLDTANMTGKSQSDIDKWVKEHTKTILNQAWFDSEHTPYSGTPHAGGKSTPDRPDASKLDPNTSDVTGNATCRTDTDYAQEGRQHWFSTSDEDSCDQVGTIVTPTTSSRKLGSISGLYWEDTDRNGVRDDGESKRFAGQTVILYDKNGRQVASTKTDKDGKYSFTHLDADGDRYTIQFSRISHREFTTPDANDTDKEHDASSTDSDASTDEDDYGRSTVTVTLTQDRPDKTDVDAGVLPETWIASMPHTGMGLLLPFLMIVSIASLVAAIILLGKEGRK